MPAEAPLHLQVDMFTGALVDTRTEHQKRRDHEFALPQQMLMFSQSDIARIDVNPHPRMKWDADASAAPLILEQEDTRTEVQKEAERERAAREYTVPLFEEGPSDVSSDITADAFSPDEEMEGLAPTEVACTPEETQATALAELERVVTDISQTIAAAPDMLRAQSMWLALATVEASAAGVSKDEVISILQRLDGVSPKTYPRATSRYGMFPTTTSGLLPALNPDSALQPSLV